MVSSFLKGSSFFIINSEWPKTRQKRAAHLTSSTTPDYYAGYLDGKMRYVELAFVADNRMYKKYDSSESKVHDRLHAIANIVNSVSFEMSKAYKKTWI